MRKGNDATLADLGEWGFLDRLLPRLRRRSPSAFIVPPGDDAAVLSGGERPALSIDGLTEGTHFRSGWEKRLRSLVGISLGRALAWKLLGACVSDLVSMGRTDRRWAMIYLGAPATLPASFLSDLYRGLDEAARRFDCALAGGDTVRAKDISIVGAVGGRLIGRALTRRGGRPGLALCVAGAIGDSSVGLDVLDGRAEKLPTRDARYFVRRFFDVRPDPETGARLSRERGVAGAMDVSDALSDCISIFCRDSGVGAEVDVASLPVSPVFRRHFSPEQALSAGEDYALLFAAEPATARRLERTLGSVVIGRLLPRRAGIHYHRQHHSVMVPPAFQHFS